MKTPITYGAFVKITYGFYEGQYGTVKDQVQDKEGRTTHALIELHDKRLKDRNPFKVDVRDLEAVGVVGSLMKTLKEKSL